MKDDEGFILCKKIKYKSQDFSEPRILLGIILKETDKIVFFQTAKKRYVIPKSRIISISDSEEVFVEGVIFNDTDS